MANIHLTIQTTKHKEIIDITEEINSELKKVGGQCVLCTAFVKHTTAALTTADLDPGTDLDMLDAFDAIMPKLRYRHPHNPGHVTDHILSSIIGPSVTIPVSGGQLQLGIWQRVILLELDGPRAREIILTVI